MISPNLCATQSNLFELMVQLRWTQWDIQERCQAGQSSGRLTRSEVGQNCCSEIQLAAVSAWSTYICHLPNLAERSQLDQERPSGAMLMGDPEHLVSDRVGFREKLIGSVRGHHRPGPWCVDRSVNHEISDMDALGSELTRY